MTRDEIMAALLSLRPGAQWSMHGPAFADIQWLDVAQQMPTEAEVAAEVSRLSAALTAQLAHAAEIRSDSSRADMLARLQSATPAQIDAWLANNVTNLAQARTVLGIILKLIALDARR